MSSENIVFPEYLYICEEYVVHVRLHRHTAPHCDPNVGAAMSETSSQGSKVCISKTLGVPTMQPHRTLQWGHARYLGFDRHAADDMLDKLHVPSSGMSHAIGAPGSVWILSIVRVWYFPHVPGSWSTLAPNILGSKESFRAPAWACGRFVAQISLPI